jgi:hypothetical protein
MQPSVAMVRCEPCGDWVQRADAVITDTGVMCTSCANPERRERRVRFVASVRRGMREAA